MTPQTCGQCGRALPVGAVFCGGCGTVVTSQAGSDSSTMGSPSGHQPAAMTPPPVPPPPPAVLPPAPVPIWTPPARRRPGRKIASGVAMVLLAVVAGASTTYAVTHRGDSEPTGSGAAAVGPSGAPATEASTSGTEPDGVAETPPSETAPTETPPSEAPPTETPEQALDRIAREDVAAIEAMDGQWTAQLSSKAAGTKVGGQTYTAQDVLDLHLELESRYPGALLVDSTGWGSWRSGGFWITLSGETFTTSQAVLDWCVEEGWGPGDCYAKRPRRDGDWEADTDQWPTG